MKGCRGQRKATRGCELSNWKTEEGERKRERERERRWGHGGGDTASTKLYDFRPVNFWEKKKKKAGNLTLPCHKHVFVLVASPTTNIDCGVDSNNKKKYATYEDLMLAIVRPRTSYAYDDDSQKITAS
jgi:hypothetical protein